MNHTAITRWIALGFVAALLLGICAIAGISGPVGAHSLQLPLGAAGGRTLFLPAFGHILLFVLIWVFSVLFMLSIPRRLRARTEFLLILCLAALCRIAFLPLGASDDVNRYLWEGRILAHGMSPYVHAPDDPSLVALAGDDPYHPAINHPDMPAAYPPLVISLFAVLSQVAYTPLAIKLFMIVFDLGTLWALYGLLRQRHLAVRWCVLYALSPLVLYSFAGHGHFDAIQNFFLLAALFCYGKRRWMWMFACAGLAIQSKYVAVLAVPFLLRRDNWRYAWLAGAAALLPFVPVLAIDHRNMFSCLAEFSSRFAFNGCVHGFLLSVFRSLPVATALTRAMLLGSVLAAYWKLHPERNPRYRDDALSGTVFVLGALLVLSPTVHFWYLTWILPLVILRPSAPWLLLSLTAAAYFPVIGVQYVTGKWELPLAAQLLEWLPFCLLLARDGCLAWQRSRSGATFGRAATVTVIIPALNETAAIEECIAAVRTDPAARQIIVVDGGSTDGTAAHAREAGAEVLLHDTPANEGGGRGGQIAAALDSATGDVIAIVHADTRVTAPSLTHICSVLDADRSVVGGALGSVFDTRRWWIEMIRPLNDLRAALFGVPFGDQVQFFRRRPVLDARLFPAIPLMEDVELALRLNRLGRQVFLFGTACVSARQWRRHFASRTCLIVRLLAKYLLLRAFRRADPDALYQQYYGRAVPDER